MRTWATDRALFPPAVIMPVCDFVRSLKSGNFIKFFRTFRQLKPIERFAGALNIGIMRSTLCEVCRKAFHSRNGTLPVALLERWLNTSADHVQKIFSEKGFQVIDGKVFFHPPPEPYPEQFTVSVKLKPYMYFHEMLCINSFAELIKKLRILRIS
ncbi:unnamed protein product [Soboliphyme baturini]|uniref:Transposase n=1 Tax=Soboliphyme baturini TaxID=241478 RepID=A0A183J4N3_9BILA|nr:unnamed protein product [Soboliphyme baturini]